MSNSDWQNVQLGDVAQELTVGYVGSMTKEYVESGIPFLRSKNVEPFNIKWEDMRYIGGNFHKKIKKSSLSPGDVVIVRTGKPGSAAIIPEWLKEANCSDLVIVRPGNDLDARFLVYYLNSLASHHINSHLVGAVQQHFNVGSARTLRLKLPPLPEQKAIASILSSLDDKIELNQQMNQTLEAMARAIFKSWFVDFDPVRAKMAGKQPMGMDAATANLFPDSFEESALGLIPKGWRVGVFSDLVNILSGGTPKTSNSEYWNGNIKWFSVKDAPNPSDVFVVETEKRITQLGVEKSATQILQEGVTIITARGTVGKLALIGSEMAMNQSCFGIQGKNKNTDYFTYFNLYSVIYELQCKSHGSVFDTINRQTFQVIQSIIPQTIVMQEFDDKIDPIMKKIKHNLYESRTLANIRDTLLPKLMSGEIRVKEAETIIEEVT